jgi:hypothetical protein
VTEGILEGEKLGTLVVGLNDGTAVGMKLGAADGRNVVGKKVGIKEGMNEGMKEGIQVGVRDGTALGFTVGRKVGKNVGINVGRKVGDLVGLVVGLAVPVGRCTGTDGFSDVGSSKSVIVCTLPLKLKLFNAATERTSSGATVFKTQQNEITSKERLHIFPR